MKIIIITIALLSILIACTPKNPTKDYPKPLKDALKKSTQAIVEKYHLHPAGAGISMPKGKLNYLGIYMYTEGPLSIEELRPMMVGAIKLIVNEINANKENIPYLFNYPATENNVSFSISLMDKDSNWIDYPEIRRASLTRGNIWYDRSYKDENGITRQATLLKETYAEALEKLQNESQH